ncbi:transglutaminase family protein [Martelella soudanensis]|uniref:transglutaminase family protein n=1 Tax=unclassified Martelella TaxID=2629616 RepID=UPI0015DEE213|nr:MULTISPECIES: transglutaminase family protein [unclassified Martelella]
MTKLSIRHRTTYSYRYPVLLAPHRLTIRPRESHDLLLVSHDIDVSPGATLNWSTDVFGNSIATASFAEPTASLAIDSAAVVDLRAANWPIFNIAVSAINYPFFYEQNEWKDLGALRDQQYPDPAKTLDRWVRGFVGGDTLSLLKDISAGIANRHMYLSREAEGTQAPVETLTKGSGTCRDFAVLFAEAARLLGFGARIVSGYLYNPARMLTGSRDSGTTHAWVDVFLPGAGWITFDPTNRSMGSANLIPVAVARDIAQTTPISGGFTGASDAFLAMNVAVDVMEL